MELLKRLVTNILLPAVLSAALVPATSLEALVARSPLIVEGRIGTSWMSWDPSRRHIWTHYRVEPIKTVRGSGEGVVVSEPGGRIGEVEETVSGSVPYAAGEHVFLFLFRTLIGYWRTTGGSQGKLT